MESLSTHPPKHSRWQRLISKFSRRIDQLPKHVLPLIAISAFAITGTIFLFQTKAAGSTISGYNFHDQNRDGIKQASEPAFQPGHRYYLMNAVTGTFVTSTLVNADGSFVFTSIAPGRYQLVLAPTYWYNIRENWVPTTTSSVMPEVTFDFGTEAKTADFGWREIVKSSDINAPITQYTGPDGMVAKSLNDAVTAKQVYDLIHAGPLIAEEAGKVTVIFASPNGTSCATAQWVDSQGVYTGYTATCGITYLRWLSSQDTVLFHEYGHAWSAYYAAIAQQDPYFGEYLALRGLTDDPRLRTSHAWSPGEMIAEDYRQFFGTPSASAAVQENRDIPLAKDVPGLKDYLEWEFRGKTKPNGTPDTTAPSAPAGLTATAISSTQVNLTWTASTDNVGVTGYDVYRGTAKVGTVAGTSYADTGLTASSSYSYYVIARDATGNSSAKSTTVSVTTPSPTDATKPSTPTNLAASSTTTQVNLTWTASTDNVGVTGYYVVRNGTTIATASGTTYTDTGVSPSTTYSYTIYARDAAGNNSMVSNTATVTTPALADTTAPSMPSGLTATAISTSQVNLAWSASTDNVGVTGYDVYRGTTKIATVSSTSYGNTNLSPNTTYSYYVIARDAAGNSSPKSVTISATTLASAASDTTSPTAPSGLTAEITQRTKVRVRWNKSTDNVGVTGYHIYRGGIRVGTVTATNYIDTPPRGVINNYYVRAFDAAGNLSLPSNTIGITVP